MSKYSLFIALLCATASPVLAQASSTVPSWQDLEEDYARDGTIVGAQSQLTMAIPSGTSEQRAVSELGQVGATCKPKHHAQNVERCLIHQYSLADGAADDIRWTVSLNTVAGRVDTISLDRYVDRHGPN